MTPDEFSEPSGNQLRDEAAFWFARMRGPEAEGSKAEFEAWLARGAFHRSAYNRIAEVFNMGKILTRDESEIAPKVERRSAASAVFLLFIGMALAAVILLLLQKTISHPSRLIATGAHGQVDLVELVTADASRDVRLGDGSTVTLRPQTLVTVSMTATTRTLRLERGEARFVVAHDGRSFIVSAGSGSITATGTIFDVGIDQDAKVRVRLIEGSIDVRTPGQGAGKARMTITTLRPGESLAYVEGAVLSDLVRRRDARFDPSPQEIATFEATRLGELLDKANRRAAVPIVLSEQRLADLEVSGHFRIHDTSALAQRLGELLALHVDRDDPGRIVLKPSN